MTQTCPICGITIKQVRNSQFCHPLMCYDFPCGHKEDARKLLVSDIRDDPKLNECLKQLGIIKTNEDELNV